MIATTEFTVYMHATLLDALDEGFSPMDGIQAINDLFVGLPLQHRSHNPKRKRWRAPKMLTVFRGRFSWYPWLGFSYVEIENQLHVIELWFDEKPERHRVDVILEQQMLATAESEEGRVVQAELSEAI